MGISFDFRSEDYGELQHLVDALFAPGVSRYATVTKLDVLMRAEAFDLCADLAEVIDLLPSATFTRTQLCDQMNSILSGHGWGGVYGTVEYAGESFIRRRKAVFHEPCENG